MTDIMKSAMAVRPYVSPMQVSAGESFQSDVGDTDSRHSDQAERERASWRFEEIEDAAVFEDESSDVDHRE